MTLFDLKMKLKKEGYEIERVKLRNE